MIACNTYASLNHSINTFNKRVDRDLRREVTYPRDSGRTSLVFRELTTLSQSVFIYSLNKYLLSISFVTGVLAFPLNVNVALVPHLLQTFFG